MKRSATTRTGLVAAAGAVLVLGAACGGDRGAGGSGTPPQAPVVTTVPNARAQPPDAPTQPPGAPALPPGATALAPDRVDASALPKQYSRQVWTTDGGHSVGLRGVEGGCSRASARLAGQDGGKVHITVVESRPRTKQACTMELRTPKLAVNLGEPLGERTVVLTAKKVYQ